MAKLLIKSLSRTRPRIKLYWKNEDRMNLYYVYELIDHRTGEPFYVGKGCGDRKDRHVYLTQLGMDTGNKYKENVINKIFNETSQWPESRIVAEFNSEKEAYDYETSLIEKYGIRNEGGILTNLCKDARPPSHKGRKRSKEFVRNLSESRMGEGNPMFGKKVKDSTKEKWKESRSNPYTGKFGKEHPVTGFKHSQEEIKRRIKRSSKTWQVTNPDGETFVVFNLTKWCKENGHRYSYIYQNSGGWQCQKIM
jgi:hypothetical protein